MSCGRSNIMATKRKTAGTHNGSNGIRAGLARAEQTAHSLERTASQAQAIEEATVRLSAGGNEQAAAGEQMRASVEAVAASIEQVGATLERTAVSQLAVASAVQQTLREHEQSAASLQELSISIAASKK